MPNISHPAEELVVLRRFLERLQSGELTIHKSGNDVTPHEVTVIKLEIEFLEKVLNRLKNNAMR